MSQGIARSGAEHLAPRDPADHVAVILTETATLPTVVPTVQIAGRTFVVIGVLDPLPLNADIDRAVLIGGPAAESYLGAVRPN